MFGLVTKRRLMSEIASTGASYRSAIDDANGRAARAEAQIASLVRSAIAHRHFDGTVTISVRLEPLTPRNDDREFAEKLSRRITEILYGLHRDWRQEALTGAALDLRRVDVAEQT